MTVDWESFSDETRELAEVRLLGTVDMRALLALQKLMVHEVRQQSQLSAGVLICEHPPALSAGSDATLLDLPADKRELDFSFLFPSPGSCQLEVPHTYHPSKVNQTTKLEMSFQDVGKRNSNRPTATGGISSAPSSGNARPPSSGSSTSAWGSLSIPAATAMSQISDSLTQYQVCIVICSTPFARPRGRRKQLPMHGFHHFCLREKGGKVRA